MKKNRKNYNQIFKVIRYLVRLIVIILEEIHE